MTHNKKKILIVDDNPDFVQLTQRALAAEYDTLSASNGQEGMIKAKKESPDLILLDVMMPGVSGLDMLHMLMADEATHRIPVIIVTVTRFDPATEMTFKVEMNVKSFLHKPLEIGDLKEELARHLGKVRSPK